MAAVAPIVLLTVLVARQWGPLQTFDSAVTRRTSEYGAGGGAYVGFWRDVTLVLDPWVFRGIAVLLAVWLWVRPRARALALWLVVATGVAYGIDLALGAIVDRDRPAGMLVDSVGFAYPSDHATTVALVAGAVLLILPVVRGWRRDVQLVSAVVAVALVLLVSLSRVALAAANPTDVVGGWAVALAVLSVTAGAFRLRPRRRPRSARRIAADDRAAGAEEPAATARTAVCAVVLNPAKFVDEDRFRRRVEHAVTRAGFDEVRWLETTVADPGRGQARAAIEAEVDLVLVAGGDGTVRIVCGELAGSGVPLGILPAGTGNLLARNLDIPLDLDEALALILDGEDQQIDVASLAGDGVDEDEHFMAMAGIGLDAAIMTSTAETPELKRHLGWTAYAVAAARNFSFPSIKVEIRLDDAEPMRRNVRTVVVANVGNLQGGIELMPQAAVDDGLLDVLVIAPRKLIQWPRLVLRVLATKNASGQYVEHFTCRRVDVSVLSDDAAPRQLDGDPIDDGHGLIATVDPGSLVARLPRARPTLRGRVQQFRDDVQQLADRTTAPSVTHRSPPEGAE